MEELSFISTDNAAEYGEKWLLMQSAKVSASTLQMRLYEGYDKTISSNPGRDVYGST